MSTNRRIPIFLLVTLCLVLQFIYSPAYGAQNPGENGWTVSALPASVRLDPSSGKIIEDRPDLYSMQPLGNLLEKNWVYDGNTVSLHAARGEYVSFQFVLENKGSEPLKDIIIRMAPFALEGKKLDSEPELFLEWAVEAKVPSTGYEKSSLGPGWYTDALIPLEKIQMDVSRLGRLHYPLELPDFRNRIDNQRFLLVWVDQWVPEGRDKAGHGTYTSEITVRIGELIKSVPVRLKIWDFALPAQNRLAGNCQHEGF
ncbi:MAG: hypothetical protein U9P14_06205, partial [Gemmatimonadota bacterium]|nr:hypothetical protein [Gemmatimonadota bacterium]